MGSWCLKYLVRTHMTDISARQYGGYGVGGFVECCEGVVDPLFLLSIIAALAGLTYWIRLQVVTNIMGRSFSDRKQADDHDDLDILSSLSDFQNISRVFDKDESEGGGPLFGCYTDFGFCISSSVMVA